MVNKKYICKGCNINETVNVECFIVSWYLHNLKNDKFNYKIDAYKNVIDFKSGKSEINIGYDDTLGTDVSISDLNIGKNDEERILNYVLKNKTLFKDGVIKTL